MNPSFQRRAGFPALRDGPGTRMDASSLRYKQAAPLRTSRVTGTARLFCGKMFAVFAEKSWQRRAWFSDSDRTCGRERARCEQVVSNSIISSPEKSVTASSLKAAGNLRRNKVNICVPRFTHPEAASSQKLTASKNGIVPFFVERKSAPNPSQSPTFSLPIAAIL